MRTRTLVLALLIAASLAPVAGCSDSGDAAPHQSQDKNQDNNLSSEPADQSSGDESHGGSPIPVNDPNRPSHDANNHSSDNSHNPDDPNNQAASSARQNKRYQQLQQRIQALQNTRQAQKNRLDQQAKRLSTLEDQVKKLTQRLRRLSQSAAADDGPADGSSETAPTPDPVSPQAQSDGQTSPSSPASPTRSDEPDNSSGDGDEDSGGGDAETGSANASPAAAPAQGPNIVAQCPPHDSAPQYDVFFQASSPSALAAALDQAKAAGLSDRYKSPSARRLYLGRYGTCALAARRRDDVHQRTGLALNIRTVSPRHAGAPKSISHHHGHEYGTRANTIRNAPFAIIGVEIRGTHHYLGVGPREASRLSGVSWLTRGDTYKSWTLRAIRTDAGTATFTHDGRTVAVALPRRG